MSPELLSILGAISGLVGAITGVVALVLNFRSHSLDNACLELSPELFILRGDTVQEPHLVLELDVTNVGRRIARIKQVGIEIRRKGDDIPKQFRDVDHHIVSMNTIAYFFSADKDGKTIDLGEGQLHHFEFNSVPNDEFFCMDSGATVVVQDTLGTVYRAKLDHIGEQVVESNCLNEGKNQSPNPSD